MLWEELHNTWIRKTRKVLFSSIERILQKKEIKWAIWNAEKSKIVYQVDKLSEKFNSKSKSLRTKQEKKKKKWKLYCLNKKRKSSTIQN